MNVDNNAQSGGGTPSISDVLVNDDCTISQDKLKTAIQSAIQNGSGTASAELLTPKINTLSQDIIGCAI
ncbi:hypothetical protein PKNA1_H1_0712750 [Plasmodium knowlesi strain H]|uniref:Uncharacterized protein n=1 Tax=Plasmodium knowlesi (strain H) TaxID=5851 RepID=A0A1A7VRH4_PLAKH|nr:hypothetical protein PKNA1_H1_0712750 [Plasmodium knowlesi strain H]